MSPAQRTHHPLRVPPPQLPKAVNLGLPITMSVTDAIARSSLSRTTLWRAHRAGRLQMVKVGRRTLVRTDSLLALLGGTEMGPS